MKIYTKTGDAGTTSLLGGTRVAKHHLRIEAYGTVDELNAQLGFLCDSIKAPETIGQLRQVQHRLFSIGSALATEPQHQQQYPLELTGNDIELLEQQIDDWQNELPPLTNFVLPGGHLSVSSAHICRTVCRRAERRVLELHEVQPVAEEVLRYLNRLSDYFFAFSRFLTYTLGVEEVIWQKRS